MLEWPTSAKIPLVHAPEDYTAMVTIGTQTFALLVDTGSSTTVVAGASCDECSVSPLYAPGPSAKDTGNKTEGSYFDGSVWDGEIYVDQVGLGDGTPSVPLEIASITNEMLFFRDDSAEGILGLGTPDTLVGDTTAFVTVANESTAPMQLSFELCPEDGAMWIGDFDATAVSAAPQLTPLIAPTAAQPYYNLAVSDLAIGGASLGFGASTFRDPFLDTGTTDFLIPTEVYNALVAAVNQAAGTAALFPGQALGATSSCFTATGVTAAQVDAMLPAMSTSFPDGQGGTFTMTSSPTRSYLDDQGGGQFCLAITDGGTGDTSVTILGDAFMRAFVSVLDLEHDQVGFAPDIGCPTSITTGVTRAVRRPRAPRRRAL